MDVGIVFRIGTLRTCLLSDYNPFRLHVLEFLEINVANSLVEQFQAGFDFEAFCIHCWVYLAWFEDKHSAFSATMHDEAALLFDEAPFIIEPYLHPLFNDLAY